MNSLINFAIEILQYVQYITEHTVGFMSFIFTTLEKNNQRFIYNEELSDDENDVDSEDDPKFKRLFGKNKSI